MYSRILVPVDMDNTDKLTKAITLAIDTAKTNSAALIFVDVVDAVPTTSRTTEGEKMADRLTAFADDLGKTHGVDISAHVALRSDLHLNVGADIITAAKDTGCDLIVMASHMPGMKDYFLSSNAGHVASHAPVSVYVVR
ncbi:universal stress protein [Marivita sp. S6314]|uniref:universal stress protein n=1 Tax=Marivita sp. S6314 TaxID=2926406 RepID=UPI001FF12F7A|nr:universal stress protein [Marivita sp. S6314]MCK0148916.1 universal stress protein [Marivita sp. S6314]